MNTEVDFGKFHMTFLDNLKALNDGGTHFGPVPRAVWNRKYPVDNNNQIPQVIDPILLQYEGQNILIDTGLGTSKMDKKAMRNAGISEEAKLIDSLAEIDIKPEHIDMVIMTHMHNDHAGGLTTLVDGVIKSTFPKATIYINNIEWDEVRNPNKRTAGTYLKDNWEPIQDQVKTWEESFEVNEAISLHHTGGHSNGHSIVLIKQDNEELILMGDLMLTIAHRNPLWVSALDDYPMDSIAAKEKWLTYAFENNCRFIFYHEPFYAMVQFDKEGKEIVNSVKRKKEPLVPYSDIFMLS